MWEVNLRATYTVTHRLLPCMLAAQKATIICVSSVSPASRIPMHLGFSCFAWMYPGLYVASQKDMRACLHRVQLILCTRWHMDIQQQLCEGQHYLVCM